MKAKTPLRHRHHVWPFVLVLTVLILVVYLLLAESHDGSEVLTAAMAGLLGTVFFLHKGHAEDARFMKELFEHFNNRYDLLNGDIQQLMNEPDGPLSPAEEALLVDYFNLCAEEWVFRKLGYIYDPVWESWENGMRQYGKNKYVAQIWTRELETQSYYGFEFPVDEQYKSLTV